MLDKAFVMNLLKENNGIVESKQLTEAGIDGEILQRLECWNSPEKLNGSDVVFIVIRIIWQMTIW